MDTFWELGYEATSTATLVERMGLARSSLYGTFGSKEALYEEALGRYVEDSGRSVIDALRADGPALRVLEGFFVGAVERGSPSDGPARCCMIVRASLEGARQTPAVQRLVTRHLRELDDAFCDLLDRARDEGQLDPRLRPRDAARFLTTFHQALELATLAGRPRAELEEIVRQALASLH